MAETTTQAESPARKHPVLTDDGYILSMNPRTGELRCKIKCTPVDEVPKIVAEARAAQKRWETLGFEGRKAEMLKVSQYMIEHMDELAEVLAEENGKTYVEAVTMEVLCSIDFMGFFAKNARKALRDQKVPLHLMPLARSYVTYKPVGVVGIIAPWNYPITTPVSDMAPALAAGNAVVVKPSEFSSGAGQLIEKIFKESGFPEGVVRLVYGGGDVGAALIGAGVGHIAFTGSTPTGKKVMAKAAETLTPVTLELGGKDPAIILEDADLDAAAEGILWAGFSNMGQTCASVERVYIHEKVYDRFRDKLVAEAKKLKMKPAEQDSSFGAMNNVMQAEKVNEQLKDAKAKGAKVAYESELPETGYYAAPTILEDVTGDMSVSCDETFGPVIPLFRYQTEDEAIAKANDSPFGLTASIWSRNGDRAERLARRLEAGVVTINDHMITPGFAEAPWGGVKQSGIGRIKSLDALRNYSEKTYIFNDRGTMGNKFWRYPYNLKKLNFLKEIAVAFNDKSLAKRIKGQLSVVPRLLFGKPDKS